MTDATPPIPDEFEARMGALTRQIQEAADQLTRALSATVHEAEERSVQRWRVRTMMPTLTVRGVLVRGYVRHGEA